MDRVTTLLITVLAILCLWLGDNVVEGKCRGLWKNHHACLGGNGKRSDPSETLIDDERTRILDTFLNSNAATPEDEESDFPNYDMAMIRSRGRPGSKYYDLLRKLMLALQEDDRVDQ